MSTETRVAIIGSGFGGLGAAVKLKQEGRDDFVVLERNAEVGGTWWVNTYPGCQCDIPSHLYSFSFAPNPSWSETFPRQPEILAYLRRVADEQGVRPHIRFNCPVESMAWDEDAQRWRLQTADGEVVAQFVVAAPGGLSEPKLPDIPGIEAFEGTTFHSAKWDHDHDLRGERVAVIGTGASAIQFVPEIQPLVERLDLYQRTPPWISRHTNRRIHRLERRLYERVPLAQKLNRGTIYGLREALVPGFRGNQAWQKVMSTAARTHLARQVKDSALRRKLSPEYAMGCKRILLSNDWYPTLAKPNVTVVTDGIKEVRARSVVSNDGTEREVDTIILGTGFQATEFPIAQHIRGRDGTLADAWAESAQAHRGCTIAGFPNLFVITGPNTGLGHNSMVYMIESQLAYVTDALREIERRGVGAAEVTQGAQDAWNAAIQAKMPGTVWLSGGCASWYLDDKGRNVTLWPDHTWKFRSATRRFDAEHYELQPAASREATAAGA